MLRVGERLSLQLPEWALRLDTKFRLELSHNACHIPQCLTHSGALLGTVLVGLIQLLR